MAVRTARRRHGGRPLVDRLRELSSLFGSALRTEYSTTATIERLVRDADLVVGAVLVAGATRPNSYARHDRGP